MGETQDPLRVRARIALALTVATFLTAPAPWLLYRDPLAFVGMCGVAFAYLPPIMVLRSGSPRLITTVQLVSAVVTCVSFGVFILGTGGTKSAGYLALLTVPLLLAILYHETALVPLVSGVVMGVLGVAILHREGRPGADLFVAITTGPMVGLVAMYGNHTYRRLHAEQLQAIEERAMLYRKSAEAERLATMGRLVAGVAHEINNPLAFVTSNVAYVNETFSKHQLGDEGRELGHALSEATDGLHRIRDIVSDLSQLARPTSETDRCDVSASIETAVRIASVKAKGIASFNVVTQLTQPVVMSSSRLVQVIVNLLVNAVDAIETNKTRVSPGTVWIHYDAGRLVIDDDGPGFTPEAQRRLFEPFFTTKPAGKGTGLGLALCRQYLTEHGYSISAGARPGGGARFTVEFSAADATATTASSAPQLQPRSA